MAKSHQESRRSSEDSKRCRPQKEVRGVHSAEARGKDGTYGVCK